MTHNQASDADSFKISVAMIASLLSQAGVFLVSKVAADQMAHASDYDRRKASHWCRRLADLSSRKETHPNIEEREEKAAAIMVFAEHLSAFNDYHDAFRTAAQARNIDIPHNHVRVSTGDLVGDLYFLDEFIEMVEEGSICPSNGAIRETNFGEFDWSQPRTQLQEIDSPETAVVWWVQ